MGIELLPVQFIPVIFPKVYKYFCIKTESGKQHLMDNFGIDKNNIFVVNYKPDNYALDSIEDIFKHYLFKTNMPPRNEFNIVLMNHVQMRDELKETVKVLSEFTNSLGIKLNLIFGTINYAVKELHEAEIIRDLLMPDFSKYVKEIQFVDISDLPQVIVSMDCFISMSYMTIFGWANKYNIPCVVYNNSENLKNELQIIWQNKQKQIGLSDAIKEALK